MTASLPWIKWRPDKWRNEEGLRLSSLAARGLWADLLAIMHGCTPYGHLTVRGQPATAKQIVALVGNTTEREVTALLTELEENGVFTRNSEGVIFCRRMVRDEAARRKAHDDGSKGGNPLLIGNKTERDKADHTKRLTEGVNPTLKTDKRKEKEREKGDSDLRSDAAPAAPFDPQKVLWNEGLKTLRLLTGLADGPTRKLLGSLVNDAGKDHTRLLDLIRRAEVSQPDDPTSWLKAAARARGSPSLFPMQERPKPSEANPRGEPITPMSGDW